MATRQGHGVATVAAPNARMHRVSTLTGMPPACPGRGRDVALEPALHPARPRPYARVRSDQGIAARQLARCKAAPPAGASPHAAANLLDTPRALTVLRTPPHHPRRLA